MNEQRHKGREISSGNAPRPFSPPSSSDKCDRGVLSPVSGTQVSGCPQSSPRLCRHLPLSISQRASLHLALIIVLPKQFAIYSIIPTLNTERVFVCVCVFFQNTLAPHLQTRSQCLVWGAASLYSLWKTHLSQSRVVLMVAEG